jgi:competence ComEA-like helix-hairpin-helix protein
VLRTNGTKMPGLVLRFTRDVHVLTPDRRIDAQHVFQVLMRHAAADGAFLDCLCPIRGEVIPVTNIQESPARFIVGAEETTAPTAPGVAFIFNPNDIQEIRKNNELWVHLRGDFVIDVGGRAVDAEFVRAELPTGEHPAAGQPGSEFGTQGGHFESWFRVTDQGGPSVIGGEIGGVRVGINTASAEELARLPGMNEKIAYEIVARRERERFSAPEELREVRGVGETLLKKIRDLVHFD